MDERTASVSTDQPPPGMPADDVLQPYRRWATRLFTVLGSLGLLALVLLVGTDFGVEPGLLLLTLGPGALAVILYLATSLGLTSERAWAIHAVRPLCYALIAGGSLRLVVGLGLGRLDIPLEAIGALLVLSRPHVEADLPPLDARGRRIQRAVVALVVAAQVVPVISLLLARTAVGG